jgi:methylmalonyl-CoA mutase
VKVKRKLNEIFKRKGTVTRPAYQGELPEGNDGLGLMLLGVTGDQVCLLMCIQKLKRRP